MIIPMESNILATTISITMKGINNNIPILKAISNSLTMNAGIITEVGISSLDSTLFIWALLRKSVMSSSLWCDSTSLNIKERIGLRALSYAC